MPYNPGANAELNAGIDHLTNTGRSNDGSITLGGSLQADADRWNALTPHSVLASTLGRSQADTSWERLQREQGGYAPGSMEQMTDQINQGRDNID